MNLHRALATIADDPAVTAKIEIGVVALSVPLVGIAAVGYQVVLARRVAVGQDAGLPEWDDPSALFGTGFGLSVARLLYELPARVFTVLTLLLALRPLQQAARAGLSPWPGPVWEALQILGAGALVVVLYNLAYGFLSPAITALYVQRGTLRACFAGLGMLRFILRQPGAYVQVWLVRELAGVALRLIGLGLGALVGALPLVGPLAITASWGWLLFVSLLLNGCLVGQLLQLETRRQLYPRVSGAALPAGEA